MTTETQATRAFLRAMNQAQRGSVAALTGQDALACSAIAQLCELWQVADAMGKLTTVEALHRTLHAVQAKLRPAVLAALSYISGDDRLLDAIAAACERGVKYDHCNGGAS